MKKNYQITKTSTIPIDRGGRETLFGSINLGPIFKNFFDFFSKSQA